MRSKITCVLAAAFWLGFVNCKCRAITPSPAELDASSRWAAAKLDGVQKAASQEQGLIVLANHGPVQIDGRGSEPLMIGNKTYRHGLYCHAISKVIVRLPKAADSFHAEVGVDARAGGGSIVFIVSVAGKEAFRTDVMHIDQAARAIDVPLNGAKEFTLEVSDAGDGISSDQADWADARVKMHDGSEMLLGELPIVSAAELPISTEAPFSFTYDGHAPREFLSKWKCERSTSDGTISRTHTVVFTDPASGMQARCVGVEWQDCPVVEWTTYFKNTGGSDSAILENIRGVDTSFPAATTDQCALHYNFGDDAVPNSYEPHVDSMAAGYHKSFKCERGRPTQIGFPYYNLTGQGGGAIVAIGWPGQWNADVSRDDATGLNVTGGQELTHFRLHPGEEVRGPRIVTVFYRGDWMRGQNLWRRWMILHNMRRPLGKPIAPMASLCTGNFYPGLMSNAKQELIFLQQHLDAEIQLDNWWQDAGWYPCDGVTWPKTGTWEVDPVRFPKGLREVSDVVHAHGAKATVWFEPERVYAGTWLADNHPEWIHGGKAGGLLNLGIPECREWLTDHIDKLLTDQSIDIYRQDFNIDPLSYWRDGEPQDRQGITEIRHVEGYLAYWDELLRRHPAMFIDSCASGGRRNDLETMHRAVPLLRSDWYNAPEGQQCQTYGLSLWLPYQGTGCIYSKDEYWFMSSMVADLTFGPASGGVLSSDLKTLKPMVDLHRAMADCFFGDFYPLTPYSQTSDTWMAWQYDQPEQSTGIVQAFRRPESVYESARLPLHGLDPSATYDLTNLQTPATTMTATTTAAKTAPAPKITGRELMDRGLPITIPDRPGAIVIRYRRVSGN